MTTAKDHAQDFHGNVHLNPIWIIFKISMITLQEHAAFQIHAELSKDTFMLKTKSGYQLQVYISNGEGHQFINSL